MIRIKQIKMPITHNETDLKEKIIKKLNIKKEDIKNIKINKKSIDARKDINFVYEIDLETNKEQQILNKKIKDVEKISNEKYILKITGSKTLKNRPIIVGAGPAGLFAAYLLATNGYKPIVIERGEQIENRIKSVENFWKTNKLNPESNIQFGEGGAGTFSDGKLNTTIKDKNNRIKYIIKTFENNGAPKEITYTKNPHIGTDYLRKVIINIRKEIIKMGGTFLFNTCLKDIKIENNEIKEIITNKENIKTNILILALGHSSRDTIEMLNKKLIIKAKPFAIGIRVQHPQKWINDNQYKKYSNYLPNASYKLTHNYNGRGIYSFCMCPGGFVINASSENGKLAINGMSNYKRNEENANSAIVVTITSNDFGNNPLDGIKFQKELEEKAYEIGKGNIPIQLLKDFKENKKSTKLGKIKPIFKGKYELANLKNIFPQYISEALEEGIANFGTKIKNFDNDDTILAAIESRTSSPIKIERNENLESNIKGIYPCGEGAGYAGGIISAAVDGMKVAEEIIKIYKPLK